MMTPARWTELIASKTKYRLSGDLYRNLVHHFISTPVTFFDSTFA
jgi:hypothetical protein